MGDTKPFVDHGIQLAPGGGTPIMIFRQLNALFAVHSKLDYPFSVKIDILSPHFIRKNRLFV